MRIACLLPSATDICVALGLSDYIVGVTHECDLQSVLQSQSKPNNDANDDHCCDDRIVHILTSSGFDDGAHHSQSEIDARVKAESKLIQAGADSINSLYPINRDAFHSARPTVVLTQDLCGVCAPTPRDVSNMLRRVGRGGDDDDEVRIYSLDPHSLRDVADTFVAVGDLCGVPDAGRKLRDGFVAGLDALRGVVARSGAVGRRRVLLLEWIDPPYDGGHWIPDVIETVGCEVAKAVDKHGTHKSKQLTWDDIYASDPDVVLVACCGFDLERNGEDARAAAPRLRPLRAARDGRIYACNGDLNFARPGPKLLGGAVAVVRCAYDGDEDVLRALGELEFVQRLSYDWEKIPIGPADDPCDIEDIVQPLDFSAAHKSACDDGKLSYTDPDSGYQVFTEVAHRKRGKCCGSGCRHCPYNHANVKDKAARIKQPALLYEGKGENSLSKSCNTATDVKLLFFSGGKDSYLTIRALFKKYHRNDNSFLLVLLTTFDAVSRTIAHQEVHIDEVVRQASHLNLPLIGVPMHRGSSEPYVERMRRALDVLPPNTRRRLSSICFGDLHLEHIRSWREAEISKLGIALEYPLWRVPYGTLRDDLEASGVDVVVSASTKPGVEVGDVFDRDLSRAVERLGMDGFGENGEFHSLAKVWVVSRERALGIE